MKIVPLLNRNLADASYAGMMAKALPKQSKIQRPVSAAQVLYDNRDKDPEAYKAYLARPMVTAEECKGMTVREMEIDFEQAMIIDAMRKSSKNTLGDFKESGLSSVSAETRELAISAFTCSPPAELARHEIDKLVKMVEIPEPPAPVIEEKKKTIASRVMHALWKMGFPVDRVTRKDLRLEIAESLEKKK